MPHHHCLHRVEVKSLWNQNSIGGNRIPGVLTSPALNRYSTAVEQCEGRDEIRKERSKEEGAFTNGQKTFVYLIINGQRYGVHMTSNRQRQPCPLLHQGIIINVKHQGHAN